MDSITLYKNNELIMRTSSGVLQYTASQYGTYECVVDLKIHTLWKSLLLQEEGKHSNYQMQTMIVSKQDTWKLVFKFMIVLCGGM